MLCHTIHRCQRLAWQLSDQITVTAKYKTQHNNQYPLIWKVRETSLEDLPGLFHKPLLLGGDK